MPEGASAKLKHQIEAKGVETVTMEVSEFLQKGGGAVKCMIGDLGRWSLDNDIPPEVIKFRHAHRYTPSLEF